MAKTKAYIKKQRSRIVLILVLLLVVLFLGQNCGQPQFGKSKLLSQENTNSSTTTTRFSASSTSSTSTSSSSSTSSSTTSTTSTTLSAHVNFVRTESGYQTFADRPGKYDYQSAAMLDNGIYKGWYCGGNRPQPGDHIVYTAKDQSGNYVTEPTVVLSPQSNNKATDSLHACDVDVIKHSHSSIHSNKNYYVMYYECCPKFYELENPNRLTHGGCFICSAFSEDGVSWKRYNKAVWNSRKEFVDINDNTLSDEQKSPTPVITWTQEVLNSCQYIYNGKHLVSTNSESACRHGTPHYGVGHPSAIVMPNNEVWVFYYDSGLDWNARRIKIAKSTDGLNFDRVQTLNINPPNGHRYRYYHPLGLFIAMTNYAYEDAGNVRGSGYYAYSYDLLSWQGFDWPPKQNQRFGNFNPDLCSIPGGVNIFGDSRGQLTSLNNLIFLQSLGLRGHNDNTSPGHPCYSSSEDSSYGRGSTWGLFTTKGKFEF